MNKKTIPRMTQPILLTGQVYAVEVPESAQYHRLECVPEADLYELIFYKDGNDIDFPEEIEEVKSVDLPAGNWQLITTTNGVTEDIAKAIVQVISNGKFSGSPQYRRYDRNPVKDTPAKCWTRDPRHALETLLTSKGLDLNKNYTLLKNQ